MPPTGSARAKRDDTSGAAATEGVRRLSRYTYAKQRLAKMRETEPRFTAEQIDGLCAVLRGEAE